MADIGFIHENGELGKPDPDKALFYYRKAAEAGDENGREGYIVSAYREKIQCFRHASDEALQERNSYSDERKDFLIDYGIIIIKAIHSLVE